MTKISINGVHLYYQLLGKGKPIVLIAGFTCDHTIWKYIAKELSKNFQVLIFDNRGVGQSDCPKGPYTIEQMAQDTLGLIKALGLEKPHILGHSMGGSIAQHIGFYYPESIDKLIIANSLVKFSAISTHIQNTIFEMRRKKIELVLILKTLLPWLFSNDFVSKKENVESFIKLHVNDPYPMSDTGFMAQFHALHEFNSEEWLHKIQKETLVIGSDSDLLCPKDSFLIANRIPNSKFVLFEKMGHMPPVEKPNEFIEIVRDFL